MSEMVDRVAEALFATKYRNEPFFDFQASFEKDEYLRQARAAIEAMREPTAAMINAADYYFDRGSPLVPWQDMIDEALKG